MAPRVRAALLVTILLVLAAGCSTLPPQPPGVVERKDRAAEYTTLGNRAFEEGNYSAALTFFGQALALNQAVDNEPGVVLSLGSVGKVHLALGELDEAEHVFVRAQRRAETLADPVLDAQCLVNLAELELGRGRPEAARDLLAAVLPAGDALTGTADLAILYHTLAVAERKLGAMDAALTHLEAALAINRRRRLSREIASNLYVTASIHSALGDYPLAAGAAQEALRYDKEMENSLGIAQDLQALGAIALRVDNGPEAFGYLERAYGVYEGLQSDAGRLRVLPELIDAAKKSGRTSDAEAYSRLLLELGGQ
jgi:tetratricopeptide (TPR) repeat protein